MNSAYRTAVDAAAIFSETDITGKITYVNDQFCAISGYTKEELIGKNHRILNSSVHPAEFFADMWLKISNGRIWKGIICNRRKDGELYWVQSTIIPMHDEVTQEIEKYVSIRFDITEKRKLMKALQWRAEHDSLTGLPNRYLLLERLELAINKAKRYKESLAICMLDLDGFKSINDRYGHAMGDKLLVAVADRLKESMRQEDILSRLGGDEFVLALHMRDASELENALNRFLAEIASVFTIDGIGLYVSASIGVTLYPSDEEQIETLLRHADQAMYRAKQSGRNCFCPFDISSDIKDKNEFETIMRVGQALSNGELILHYQPKVNLREEKIIGFEALLRWDHPREGLIPPLDFIPLIEETELIVRIGDWVIESALRQLEEWSRAGYHWSLSVNISALHFHREDFTCRLKDLLSKYPAADPSLLDIEIVETVLLENVSVVQKHIIACQELGVTFSLDDFGTGFSSLSYLNKLPTQNIKIDKSFIHQITDDQSSLILTKAIISIARSLNRAVIAEGIETIEQAELLISLGCDIAQGYGIARPMPVELIPQWAARFHPVHLPLANQPSQPRNRAGKSMTFT